MGGQGRTITVRCERCEQRSLGAHAPAMGELVYGPPDDAGEFRSGPLPDGWWLRLIDHASTPSEHGRIHWPAKDTPAWPLADPRQLQGLGPCHTCRKGARLKAGTLIRRAVAARRAGVSSIYV